MGNDNLTIRDVSKLLGVHPNTIRNYIRRGQLQADKVTLDGKETWVIGKNHLYSCGVPEILNKLGPQDVITRYNNVSKQPYVVPDKWLEEITRLVRINEETNRELSEAVAEREILKYQVQKVLPAAQEERDQLKEEVGNIKNERDGIRWTAEELRTKAELLEKALEEARANAKWTWKRRVAKTTEARKGTAA